MSVRRVGCLILVLPAAALVLLLAVSLSLPSARTLAVLESPNGRWRAVLRHEQDGPMFAPDFMILYLEPNDVVGHALGWLGNYKAVRFAQRNLSEAARLRWCREDVLAMVLPASASEVQPLHADPALSVRVVPARGDPCPD